MLLLTTLLLILPGDAIDAAGKWLEQIFPWLAGPDEPPSPWTDKIVHLSLFTGCGLSCVLAWPRPARVLLALVVYGALTEVVQSFVPGRSASAADLLADSIGAGLGLLLALWLNHASTEKL